ncbi:ADP compounds hydrolase NudE [compost metagenome]
MSQCIQVVLARDLYPERLPGDEPETIRVERFSLRDISRLALSENFSEGRALAAMYLVRDLLTQRGEYQP